MAQIFINYRRDDSITISGRIYDRLVDEFGRDAIFKDMDDILAGDDFLEAIDDAIRKCDILLAIIGPQWLTLQTLSGQRRIDAPGDYVRHEIETGLRLDNMTVIPVLVHETPMPGTETLPESLRPLGTRNAVKVRDDPDFHGDMNRVIDHINRIESKRATDGTPLPPSHIAVDKDASSLDTIQVEKKSIVQRSRLPLFAAGGLGFVIFVALIIVLSGVLSSAGDADNDNVARASQTPSETRSSSNDMTGVAAEDRTLTLTSTNTPSSTVPTSTTAPTETPNDVTLLALTDAAQTWTHAVELTDTAAQWTDPPPSTAPETPNRPATLNAIRTETATFWTLTPSDAATNISAPSNTPASTYTSTIELVPTSMTGDADTIASPLELANSGVNSNAEWTPYIQEFDGVLMALVPSGCFEMGHNAGEDDEKPIHTQCIEEPFWIDVSEVTNEQFGTVGCADTSNRPTQPRNCLTWYQANAFCESRSARLPSEVEWEYAARGPDGLQFPWGMDWVSDNMIWGLVDGAPADVGSKPQGASWVGAMDMSGNLWEWTNSVYRAYPYDSQDGRELDGIVDPNTQVTLRGAAFNNRITSPKTTERIWVNPGNDNTAYGFRCVRSI